MKKELLLIPLALLLAISLVAIGCPAQETTTPPTTPTTTTPPAPEIPKEIRIGDTVSFTGMLASFGLCNWGAQAAFEDINKQGGIYVEEYNAKIPVRYITLDVASDPLKVAPLVEDLILREKVNFLGPHTEPPQMHQGLAMMAEKYKIPACIGMAVFESWMGLKESAGAEWHYTVGTGFHIAAPYPPGDWRAGNKAYVMMDTWFGALGTFGGQTNKKVAVFAADNADGRGWYMAFTGAAVPQGYDCYRAEDGFGLFPGDTTDFTPVIEEWKDAGCEILWGNCAGPQFGILWKQCHVLGYQPKLVFATNAAAQYQDIEAWGGDLPNGVCLEVFWSPSIQNAAGIGDTTPQSLAQRYFDEYGEPWPQGIGYNYMNAQILCDAIERAGTLDPDEVLAALNATDMNTIYGRATMINGWSAWSCQMGQWWKTDKPWAWESPIVFSYNENMPATADLIFPIPYD
jgi:branched-chain amino acid transport system substrate-binding protein